MGRMFEEGKQSFDDRTPSSSPRTCSDRGRGECGALIDLLGSRHRILAVIGERVLATDVATHHPYLIQDEDGSIQLPRLANLTAMIERGEAGFAEAGVEASATDRMRAQIELLDRAGVAQGDKAIWIHLAMHWTPTLEARFGPYDQPWKVRRWRSALRRAAAVRSKADRTGRTKGAFHLDEGLDR